MKNINIIFKKELDKIFHNFRILFGTIIFPGLMLFIIYGAMGFVMSQQTEAVNNHECVITVSNFPSDLNSYFTDSTIQDTYGKVSINKVSIATDDDLNMAIENVRNGKTDLLVLFDKDFNKASSINKSEIVVYSNSNKSNSTEALSRFKNIFELYKNDYLKDVYELLDIYEFSYEETGKIVSQTNLMLSTLLPMLLVTLVMSGAISICSDSFAGEKERGTLATTIMTPISKTELVMGKILSSTVIAFLSGISSFIGIVGALPTVSGLNVGDIDISGSNYVILLLIIIVFALLSVGILSLISAISRTAKEANMYSMPVYILAILLSIIPGFTNSTPKDSFSYIIPIYNCSIGIKGILTQSVNAFGYTLIIISNIIYFILICIVISKMFKKEKILFGN